MQKIKKKSQTICTTMRRRLEEEYRINKEFLDRKYSDEQVYAEARESIMRNQVKVAEGVFMDIYDAFSEFEDKFGKGMGILGGIIKSDFLDQLEQAQRAVERLRDTGILIRPRENYDSDYRPRDDEWDYRDPRGSSVSGGKLSDMSKTDYQVYLNMKKLWEDSKARGDQQYMDYAHKRAQEIRDKYGITSDMYSYDELKNIPWEQLKIKGYDRGGKIDYTGLVMAHGEDNPEWMLRDHHLQKIISDSVLSTIKIAMPKIPNVVARQGTILQIDNLINVEGNVTKETIPLIKSAGNDIAETLKNLNKGGIFRPVKI